MRKWISALIAVVLAVVALGVFQEMLSSAALTMVLFCTFLVTFVAILLLALLDPGDADQGRTAQGMRSIDPASRQG